MCSADTECEVHSRVSLKQREIHVSILERETHVPQTHVSASKRETHLLPTPKRETHILPILEHDFRVSNTKLEVHILRQTQPMLDVHVSTPREIRISIKKREVRVQIG